MVGMRDVDAAGRRLFVRETTAASAVENTENINAHSANIFKDLNCFLVFIMFSFYCVVSQSLRMRFHRTCTGLMPRRVRIDIRRHICLACLLRIPFRRMHPVSCCRHSPI